MVYLMPLSRSVKLDHTQPVCHRVNDKEQFGICVVLYYCRKSLQNIFASETKILPPSIFLQKRMRYDINFCFIAENGKKYDSVQPKAISY